jgi:EmrB/QacA subfamily drug resistance transporter
MGLVVVCLGTSAAALDTAVNVALPAITHAFGLELGGIRWIVVVYVLTYSSLMLVLGKLGDLVGYRRVFRIGLLVSAAGFLACAMAPTYGLLLLGRILQGIGIAFTLACAPALATTLYPESQRTRVLGIYAAMTAFATALGPILGGLLVDWAGWPGVFAARAPLVLAALALSGLIAAGPAPTGPRGFDAVGAVMLVTGLVSVLLTFADHGEYLRLPTALMLAAVGLIVLAAFVLRQRRHPEPIIRPALFADCDFTTMNVANVLVSLASFAVLIIAPYYLAQIAGYDAVTAGIVLASGFLAAVVGASLAGRLAPIVGHGRLALAAIVLSAAGLAAVGRWTGESGIIVLSWPLAMHGVGIGLFQVVYTDLVTGTLPVHERGVAGSLTMVTRTIGTVTGATVLSGVHSWLERSAARTAGAAEAFIAAFQGSFQFAAGLTVVAGLLLVARPGLWRHRPARP